MENYNPLTKQELKFFVDILEEYGHDLPHIMEYGDFNKFADICHKIEAELQYNGDL